MTIRKALGASAQALSEMRQVRVICSTGEVDRLGEIVDQTGIDLRAFRSNSVVLWNHDPGQPIARAVEIAVQDGCLQALVQFPPSGASAKADEVYALIIADVIRGVSIGFDPKTMTPIDPANPRGPQRYLACELVEFSFVSIPAVRGALVAAKAATGRKGKRLTVSAARLKARLHAAAVPAAPPLTLTQARRRARLFAAMAPALAASQPITKTEAVARIRRLATPPARRW